MAMLVIGIKPSDFVNPNLFESRRRMVGFRLSPIEACARLLAEPLVANFMFPPVNFFLKLHEYQIKAYRHKRIGLQMQKLHNMVRSPAEFPAFPHGFGDVVINRLHGSSAQSLF
jgi:hypothetical protein